MIEDVIRLKSFPRYRVIGRELFACRVSEVDLWQHLGAPTSEVNPPLGQGSPEMFWDVEFPCGLVLGLQLDCISERLTGYLDLPEVTHAFRHLGVRPRDLWLLEEQEPAVFAEVSPTVDRDFRLWEQDGDSAPELLGSGLTERDARCQLAELDGIEPGVRMWVDRGRPERRAEPVRPLAPLSPLPPLDGALAGEVTRDGAGDVAAGIDLLDDLSDDIYDEPDGDSPHDRPDALPDALPDGLPDDFPDDLQDDIYDVDNQRG